MIAAKLPHWGKSEHYREGRFRKIWRKGGLQPLLLKGEVRVGGLVSVGMSLVFNAAFRLDGIASVYAGPNDPQIGQK